tara:strand:- start:205 stop:981 length:777 start_codon:yes stop_codon:yes gene_type:complete
MNKKNFKTAIILCGGRGTRLGSISKFIPKSLVKINGRPIIWYIIKNLLKNSFNHFILPVGYKGNLIKKYILKQKDFKNLFIEIINTGENTTIAKRIFLVKNKVISNNFLLMNGDAIFDFDLKKIYNFHKKQNYDQTFIGCENELAYGTVGVKNGKILSFDRNITFNSVKVRNKPAFTAYVYSGMSIFHKKILKINFKNYENFEKELYPQIIKKFNCNFKIFTGFWHSIDNIKDILNIKKENNPIKYKKIRKLFKKLND